jgi:hypothetical protein
MRDNVSRETINRVKMTYTLVQKLSIQHPTDIRALSIHRYPDLLYIGTVVIDLFQPLPLSIDNAVMLFGSSKLIIKRKQIVS